MAKTRYLNLDEVKPEVAKVLTLKGVSHEMVDLSVGAMVDNLRLAEKLEGSKDISMAEQIELMIKLIANVFPSVPSNQLNELTFEQLAKVMEFAQASVEEVAEQAEGNG